MIAGSVIARNSKNSEAGLQRSLGRLLPNAADPNVRVGSKIEPRGLATRSIDDEKRIGFAKLRNQTIADGTHGLRGGEYPDIVHETMRRSQRRDGLLEATGRMRFDVDDDGELGELALGHVYVYGG